jgi:NADH-quinone oxidoreductase subunit E
LSLEKLVISAILDVRESGARRVNKKDNQELMDWIDEFFSGGEESRNLIGVLLAMQNRFGYLPRFGMLQVAKRLSQSPANVFAVATFYNQFRFIPPGKYPIKVCMGTACHIKRGRLVLEHFERELGICEGQVTEDKEYSLDRVACVGCCTLAPVALVGDEVIGEMSPTKVDGLLLQHKIKREQDPGEE